MLIRIRIIIIFFFKFYNSIFFNCNMTKSASIFDIIYNGSAPSRPFLLPFTWFLLHIVHFCCYLQYFMPIHDFCLYLQWFCYRWTSHLLLFAIVCEHMLHFCCYLPCLVSHGFLFYFIPKKFPTELAQLGFNIGGFISGRIVLCTLPQARYESVKFQRNCIEKWKGLDANIVLIFFASGLDSPIHPDPAGFIVSGV